MYLFTISQHEDGSDYEQKFVYTGDPEELKKHILAEYEKLESNLGIYCNYEPIANRTSRHDIIAGTIVQIIYNEITEEYEYHPYHKILISADRSRIMYGTSVDNGNNILTFFYRGFIPLEEAIKYAKAKWEYDCKMEPILDSMVAWSVYRVAINRKSEDVISAYPVPYTEEYKKTCEKQAIKYTTDGDTVFYSAYARCPNKAITIAKEAFNNDRMAEQYEKDGVPMTTIYQSTVKWDDATATWQDAVIARDTTK